MAHSFTSESRWQALSLSIIGLTSARAPLRSIFIFVGGESPLNASEGIWKKRGIRLAKGARPKGPAGVGERDVAR